MKRLILIICFIASFSGAWAQTEISGLWNSANSKYASSDFKGAISSYDSIAKSGYAGADLYYNIGNAYFKDQQIGKAILFYNKALRLDPSDPDTIHNLKVAQGFIQDRIENVPEFFVKTWARSFMNFMSSNSWAIFSLISFAFALALCALYLLAGSLRLRKLGFYGGLLFVIIFIVSLTFSSIQYRAIRNPVEGIVMQTTVPVKSSPDAGSKDIFVLHEGTKVRVTSTFGEWKEITIADGNKGWILSNAVEMID